MPTYTNVTKHLDELNIKLHLIYKVSYTAISTKDDVLGLIEKRSLDKTVETFLEINEYLIRDVLSEFRHNDYMLQELLNTSTEEGVFKMTAKNRNTKVKKLRTSYTLDEAVDRLTSQEFKLLVALIKEMNEANLVYLYHKKNRKSVIGRIAKSINVTEDTINTMISRILHTQTDTSNWFIHRTGDITGELLISPELAMTDEWLYNSLYRSSLLSTP